MLGRGYSIAVTNSNRVLRAITFGGAYNLPAWIAQRNGYFERHGVSVEITYTPDSGYLMKSLIEGAGIEVVLALRAKFGTGGSAPDDPRKYVDPRYFRKAFSKDHPQP